MARRSISQQWAVVFRHVKLGTRGQVEPAFDDLYVVVVSPTGLHLINYGLAIGVNMGSHERKADGWFGAHDSGNRKQKQHFLGGDPLQVQEPV